MQKPIVLIGLSGTGKTTVGSLVARALHRTFVDTDALIAGDAAQSIPDIFAQHGEQHFRALEMAALRRALDAGNVVVATGAGITESAANDPLLRQAHVIWLMARPATSARRLAAHDDRPLLRADPLANLENQAARRWSRYAALADWIVRTDDLAPQAAADEIVRYVQQIAPLADDQRLVVRTPGGTYEVVIAPDALAQLPERLRAFAPRARAWIVSDTTVWPRHGRRVLDVLREGGIDARHWAIPSGEAAKHRDTVATVHDWLLEHGVERGDVLLALGGGVVGDLAGYVASTVLRGIAFVQLPTTVLAMVDSSIGGKTGVDHAAGKNLLGTFYQPRLVLGDTRLLDTLPLHERQTGWAEAIKHGVIADARLFDDLHAAAPRLLRGDDPPMSDLLRRAAAIKVQTVSGDEREQGARILLNYGHTTGHALERWSDFAIRHGDGVAMGMGVAAHIAHRLGVCDGELLSRQDAVLEAFGLPTRLPPDADPEAIMDAMRSDKKVQGQRLRWVLPTAIGAATVRGDVPDEVVWEALREATTDH
jgi:shikimate kinase / 3-dehydroquinate synthase